MVWRTIATQPVARQVQCAQPGQRVFASPGLHQAFNALALDAVVRQAERCQCRHVQRQSANVLRFAITCRHHKSLRYS